MCPTAQATNVPYDSVQATQHTSHCKHEEQCTNVVCVYNICIERQKNSELWMKQGLEHQGLRAPVPLTVTTYTVPRTKTNLVEMETSVLRAISYDEMQCLYSTKRNKKYQRDS